MPVVTVALLLLTLCGHTALWVGIINRVHSIGAPRWLVKILSAPSPTMFAVIPLAALVVWWRSALPADLWLQQAIQNRAVWCYVLPCWAIATITFVLWCIRLGFSSGGGLVRTNHTQVIDVAQQLGHKPALSFKGRLFSLVPTNQVLKIAVQQIEIVVPRLPPALDGLSIAHLTDFHFSGHVGFEYYQAVVEQALALKADIVAICGDIVDEIDLLAWIPSTLGRLRAPHGVYFILGNHDMFTGEVPRVRQALTEAGLVDLGGRWRSLNIDRAEVILAGNELPWLKPAADMQTCPPRSNSQLRVLLSHSPDQLPWARRCDFDFMMAGHTHGGQFRLPIVGPIACPSWHGVKYAAGTFNEPPTIMHVSRGISSELPLRLNCLPEVSKLILRTPPG